MQLRTRILFLLLISFFAFLIPPAVQAATSADYYKAGLQLYNARNYSMAIKYFGAAISLDPNNLAAYQGRANCEYALGDKQAALADYQKVQSVQPNPQLAQFIQMIQAQLNAPPPLPILTAAVPAQKRDVTFFKKYDVRITLGASMMSLTDFKNNANQFVTLGTFVQNDGFTPTFTGSVPDGFAPQLGIEVSQRFTPDWEGGVFFTFIPVGTVTDNISVPNPESLPTTISMQDSYNINAELIGLQGRYTFMHGDFRPYASVGLMLVPMQIAFNCTDNFLNTSDTAVSQLTMNGNFMAMGFGGQIQAGLDWDLGEGFALSPSVGFQFASASSFQATVSSGSTGTTSQGQTMTLDLVPTDFGPAIVPVANGNVERVVYGKASIPNPNLYPGDPAPSSTPMTVDLSGLKAVLQVSYSF
jgi:hypothetical protein